MAALSMGSVGVDVSVSSVQEAVVVDEDHVARFLGQAEGIFRC